MSCGHDGCACGPEPTGDGLPTVAPSHDREGGGCCGGHGEGEHACRHEHQ